MGKRIKTLWLKDTIKKIKTLWLEGTMGERIFRFGGIIGLLAISAMIFVGYHLNWQITWWYFVTSILTYSATIIALYITVAEDIEGTELFRNFMIKSLINMRIITEGSKGAELFRWVLGCHLALLLLAGGLYLNIQDPYITTGLFVACVARGLSIPFMLFTHDEEFYYHGVLGLVALVIMVSIGIFLSWHITWWYFLTSTAAYSIAIIILNTLETRPLNRKTVNPRLILGCHFAFLFLAGGLYLNLKDPYNIGVFVAATAAGFVLPFMFMRPRPH